MSQLKKTPLVVVATILMGTVISQNLSGKDQPLQHAIMKQEEVDPAEEKILAALDKPTNVEFLDLALEDCLNYLKDYHKINVWLDKQTLTEEGVSLDQPMTLKLAEVRLESILNLLLQPLQLDWVVQDEVLKITTSAWTYDHPETRTYDVQHLIDATHAPEELIAAISKCIEPGTWTGKDAVAGISHTGGVLVVRHTQRAHGEIARLIADLDEIADEDTEDKRGGEKHAAVSVKIYQTGNQPAAKVAEALQDFVVVDSWKNRGGAGEVLPLQGALVVKQTAHVHRAIQRFLAQFEPKPPALHEEPETPTPATSSRTSQDPFGMLKHPGGPATGVGKAARTNRPKSPLKKYKRTVANVVIPPARTD